MIMILMTLLQSCIYFHLQMIPTGNTQSVACVLISIIDTSAHLVQPVLSTSIGLENIKETLKVPCMFSSELLTRSDFFSNRPLARIGVKVTVMQLQPGCTSRNCSCSRRGIPVTLVANALEHTGNVPGVKT